MADSSEQPPALSILSTRGAVEEQTKKKKSEKSVKNHWIKRRLSSLHDLLSENVPPPACTSPTQTQKRNRMYKIVLTGGPCGGKTTGQVRLATFFENAGWKVFTVPETATILLGGGVKFAELSAKQAYEFQKDLLLTLLRIEDVFFNQARLVTDRNVLVICDRGAMDPSAYIDVQGWKQMLHDCGLDQFSLRDGRYDQVVHMVTAADGAEKFYTLSNNDTRKEGLDDAKRQDSLTRSVWVGHPYVDVIDNSECTKFDDKILKLVQVVCDRAGLEYNDRLAKNSKKRKWLVSAMDMTHFPKYEEFSVKHDYLLSDSKDYQARIRSRMQNGKITHTLTTRQLVKGEVVETRMALTKREYEGYLNLKDKSRARLHKKRRCFNYGIQFFHLDIYVSPMPPSGGHKQLMLLETYTTHPVSIIPPDYDLPASNPLLHSEDKDDKPDKAGGFKTPDEKNAIAGTKDPNYQTLAGMCNDKVFEDKLGDKEGIPQGPRAPKQGGMVETHDPNYQTLAGLANDKVFDNKGGGGDDAPKPPKVKPPMAGTHDPNYMTLAGLNNDEVFKDKKDGGAGINIKKPDDYKEVKGTHDPNYQTLAGLCNDEVFKDKKNGGGGNIKRPDDYKEVKATHDPNYQTLAGLCNDEVFKDKKNAGGGGGGGGGFKKPENFKEIKPTFDPNYQTLAGMNNAEVFKDKKNAGGGGGGNIKRPDDYKVVKATHDPNYQTLAGLNNDKIFEEKKAAPIAKDKFLTY